MNLEPRRIDVHHHIVPTRYAAALARAGGIEAGGVPLPSWHAESAVEMMDRRGIESAVTSISCPGVHLGNDAAARELARACNEVAAGLRVRFPGRFGAFACLPWPDVDGCLEELAYALDTLELDGVILLASAGGRYLGDPELLPLMVELDRRGAVVFVHPNVPPGAAASGLPYPAAITEFPHDTTRAVTHLIYSGTLEQCPRIRFILAHAGGTVPFLAWRLALLDRLPEFAEKAPRGALHYLRSLYYDTAMSANRHTLAALLELVGPEQILFGSDYPFLPEVLVEESVEHLSKQASFDARSLAAIERENALSLLPGLGQRR